VGNHPEAYAFESELIPLVGQFVRLRWFAAGGVLAISLVAQLLDLSSVAQALGLIGAWVLASNVLFRFLLERLKRHAFEHLKTWRWFANWQIAADWIALSWLVHFSGGYESPVILYFLFHVTLASLLLPAQDCYLQAAVAVGLVTALSLAEYVGALPHHSFAELSPSLLTGEGLRLLSALFCFASTLFFGAFLVTAAADRLRQREVALVDLKNHLEQAYQNMHTLHEMAQVVNASLDLTEVLNGIVTNAARTMKMDACSIRLLDEDGGHLYIRAAYGLSESYLQKGPVQVEKSPIDQRALQGAAVSILDVTRDQMFQYPEEAGREGIRSVLCMPLMTQEQALGVIRVYSRTEHEFTAEETEFLGHFANLAAVALRNAQSYEALAELDRAKSQFVLTAGHELKSPLAAAQSLNRVILEGYAGDVPEKILRILSRSDRQLALLQERIQGLLQLTPGRFEEHVKAPQRVSLNAAVEHELVALRPRAEARQQTLNVHLPEQALTVWGNEEDLRTLVANLVSNAIKYTPAGGTVTLSLSPLAGHAQLVVSDTGIGIPQEALPHIFDEFFRTSEAKQIEQYGTGLGLAIARRVVEAHRGRITVKSTPGQGTTFTVMLPLSLEGPAE